MTSIRNPLHVEIIPGILEKEWGKVEKRIQLVLPFAQSIHIDVIDGKFANNTTWMDPAPFAKYTKEVPFEVHLMTENPLQYVKAFANAGFTRFLGHVEKMPDTTAFLAECQLFGEAGLAFDGPTPLEAVQIPSWDDVDVVLFYTGKQIGFSNATLLPERLERVKKLRALDPFIPIEIDGGVNNEDLLLARDAGATRFASTGFLFNSDDIERQYTMLQTLVHQE